MCVADKAKLLQSRRNDVSMKWKVPVVGCLTDRARKMAECHLAHFCSLPESTLPSVEAYTGEAMKC